MSMVTTNPITPLSNTQYSLISSILYLTTPQKYKFITFSMKHWMLLNLTSSLKQKHTLIASSTVTTSGFLDVLMTVTIPEVSVAVSLGGGVRAWVCGSVNVWHVEERSFRSPSVYTDLCEGKQWVRKWYHASVIDVEVVWGAEEVWKWSYTSEGVPCNNCLQVPSSDIDHHDPTSSWPRTMYPRVLLVCKRFGTTPEVWGLLVHDFVVGMPGLHQISADDPSVITSPRSAILMPPNRVHSGNRVCISMLYSYFAHRRRGCEVSMLGRSFYTSNSDPTFNALLASETEQQTYKRAQAPLNMSS